MTPTFLFYCIRRDVVKCRRFMVPFGQKYKLDVNRPGPCANTYKYFAEIRANFNWRTMLTSNLSKTFGMLLAFSSGVAVTCGQNLSNGLIAYYPFDGNANDYSGNNNHGILNGPTNANDRFNVPNKAYYFDGNDEIDIMNAPVLNPTTGISISAWYKGASFVGNGFSPIFTKGFTSHTAPYYQYKLGVCDQYNNNTQSTFGFAVCVNGNLQNVVTNTGMW